MNIEIEPLLTHLHNQGRLRVWSLIITFFGDSILAKGGEVEASRIKALMQAMNIEAGTLRTALSRLTNDNWLERYKIGKSTIYRLSDKGLKEFGPASELIYSSQSRVSFHSRNTLFLNSPLVVNQSTHHLPHNDLNKVFPFHNEEMSSQ